MALTTNNQQLTTTSFHHFYNPTRFFCRIFSPEYSSAQCNACHTGLHYFRNVIYRDTSYSYYRQVDVFLYTNRFRNDLPQYYPCASIVLPVAASSTQEIVSASLRGLDAVYKPDYQYKKAGVTVSDIIDAGSVQTALFGYDIRLRKKQDRLSEVMDRVNASGHNLIRLAAQRSGDYTDGIRSEHRSRRYSTSLDEIIEVR